MLSGWKMLATHCPICNSALLQKEMKVHCASCNMPVMTQDQYDLRGNDSDNNNNNSNSNGNNTTYDNYPKSAAVTLLSDEIAETRRQQEEKEEKEEKGRKDDEGEDHGITDDFVKVSPIKNVPQESNKVANKVVNEDIYDGYYSDNDNIGAGNSLEKEKKIYDLNNKKRDLISVHLGELCD